MQICHSGIRPCRHRRYGGGCCWKFSTRKTKTICIYAYVDNYACIQFRVPFYFRITCCRRRNVNTPLSHDRNQMFASTLASFIHAPAFRSCRHAVMRSEWCQIRTQTHDTPIREHAHTRAIVAKASLANIDFSSRLCARLVKRDDMGRHLWTRFVVCVTTECEKLIVERIVFYFLFSFLLSSSQWDSMVWPIVMWKMFVKHFSINSIAIYDHACV